MTTKTTVGTRVPPVFIPNSCPECGGTVMLGYKNKSGLGKCSKCARLLYKEQLNINNEATETTKQETEKMKISQLRDCIEQCRDIQKTLYRQWNSDFDTLDLHSSDGEAYFQILTRICEELQSLEYHCKSLLSSLSLIPTMNAIRESLPRLDQEVQYEHQGGQE